jgi:hypothetical protein
VGDQLDLFLDSRAVMLANEAIDALSARDAAHAAAALDRLRREAPGHPAQPALETLGDALAGWRKPDADPAAIVRAVQWLDNEIAPAAGRALGPAAQAFVRGFFRDLADAARGLAYEPARATAHRAWLCLRCGEWGEAEEAARAIPGSNRNPDALHWLCVARYHRYGLAAARSSLFALAWHAPQRLPSILAELGDELLDRDWQAFDRASEWEGVQESELPAWFPAWYLLEHPVVGKELSDAAFPDTPPAGAARLLAELVELERQGNQPKLAGRRERLRRLNPGFFSLYMTRRTVHYR